MRTIIILGLSVQNQHFTFIYLDYSHFVHIFHTKIFTYNNNNNVVNLLIVSWVTVQWYFVLYELTSHTGWDISHKYYFGVFPSNFVMLVMRSNIICPPWKILEKSILSIYLFIFKGYNHLYNCLFQSYHFVIFHISSLHILALWQYFSFFWLSVIYSWLLASFSSCQYTDLYIVSIFLTLQVLRAVVIYFRLCVFTFIFP